MGDCWQGDYELGGCCNELRWSGVVDETSELDGEFVTFRADKLSSIVESISSEITGIVVSPEQGTDNN